MIDDEETKAGKSGARVLEPLLTPLTPREPDDARARRWLDDGRPCDSATEYSGWVRQ